MATKAKTSGTSPVVPAETLEGRLSDALGHLDAARHPEAKALLEQILAQASEEGNLGMARTARCYLATLARRLEELAPRDAQQPDVLALVCLNRKDAKGALEHLEASLAAEPNRGSSYYLKALAQAQLDQSAESAESLAKAIQMEPDFLFQYRMESDFDGMRHTAPFAALERA